MTRPHHIVRARPLPAALVALFIATTGAGAALATASADSPRPPLPMAVADRHLAYGQDVVVRGRLAPTAGRRLLVLQYAPAREPWREVARTWVARDGSYRVRARVRRSGGVRVRALAAAHAAAREAAAQSDRQAIAVAASLRTRRRNLDVLAGDSVRVRGALRPRAAGRRVTLERRTARGWRAVTRARTRANGHFALAYRPASTGTSRLRVAFGGDRANTPALAPAGRLTAYRPALASWYSGGGSLACGGHLTPATLGVANKTLPCGTEVGFRYHGRRIRVPVVDRGPYVGGREYDLTGATAHRLGFDGVGVVWATR